LPLCTPRNDGKGVVTASFTVVIFTLKNNKIIINNLIYQSMLRINSPRPLAYEFISKGLMFSNAFKWCSFDLFDKRIHAFDLLFIF